MSVGEACAVCGDNVHPTSCGGPPARERNTVCVGVMLVQRVRWCPGGLRHAVVSRGHNRGVGGSSGVVRCGRGNRGQTPSENGLCEGSRGAGMFELAGTGVVVVDRPLFR